SRRRRPRLCCLPVPRHGHHRDLHSFPTRRSSDLESRCPKRDGRFRRGLDWTEPERTSARRMAAEASATSGGGNQETFPPAHRRRSEEHTSELQSREKLVCRLLLEKKKAAWTKWTS